MNRLSLLLATCAVAGCLDRSEETPLFGGEPMDVDELATGIEDLAAEIHVEVAQTIAAAPRPGDRDGDFLADEIDTCPDVEDSSNIDTDLDGLGNACDADYDNNGFVTGADYAVFLAAFNSARGDATYDARVDHDRNGAIGGSDFATFLQYFGGASPARDTLSIEQVAAGDELATTARFSSGTAIATMVSRTAISSVQRDTNGRVARIVAGTLRLTRWSEAWLIEGLPLSVSGGVIGLCPRVVVFPSRPIGSISQFCSSTNYQSFALAISRP